MKANKNEPSAQYQKRIPIRTRILSIVLAATMISLVSASVIGIICMSWIRGSSEKALTEQLENNLKSIIRQKAVAADAKLEHYEKYIQFSTDYIEDMYKDPDKMINAGHMYYSPDDTREYALTRAFANNKLTEAGLHDELLFFSNVELIWDPLSHENENLITTIYAGTKNGLLTSYDRWSYISAVPEGEELIYNYFKSEWYKQGLKADKPFFTGLYVDSQGRGLTITVASPFKDAKGRIAGVNAADFDITSLHKELLSFDLGEDTFSFTLDKDGMLISPDAKDMTVEKYTGLSKDEIQYLLKNPDNLMEKNESLYISIPIERVGWTLCACVPKKMIEGSIKEANNSIRYTYGIFLAIAIIILILSVYVVNKAVRTITYPMELLGKDMKIIAGGDLKHRAKVYRNDEIGDMTNELNALVDRLSDTMNDLISAKQRADAMTTLATRDSLTGIRNKTAYEALTRDIEQKLSVGYTPFGIVMIDMNNLKEINDSYGHNNGDIAIKNVSKTICDVFAHSPVFRIGGDEFAVILTNSDYGNIEKLYERFRSIVDESCKDMSIQPWEKISAAIGYAIYDENQDQNVESVLERADKEMYKCKRKMEKPDM
ncbi:MAG: diguanylate cyclase [Eubacterium sp.]|nr:diguanylate cyclase [Eubacterium sp.]